MPNESSKEMSLISFLVISRYGFPSKQYKKQVHKIIVHTLKKSKKKAMISGSIPRGNSCIFFTQLRWKKAPIHCYYSKGLMSVLTCSFSCKPEWKMANTLLSNNCWYNLQELVLKFLSVKPSICNETHFSSCIVILTHSFPKINFLLFK